MPRFNQVSVLDHTLDNEVRAKKDLRFSEQETAEEFATTQYQTDFIPRSVVPDEESEGQVFMILENPTEVGRAREVFHINSMPGEG